jgi:type II secretory ATPase GspE/PulE/Tfp pilus assembly ATPase PilB-like protein
MRDYTFARGLKAVLRQNPDVVMVGEIRDSETAEIAVHASLTGHLVLSSLHTNNAAGAVPRFLAMGIKPFLVTPSLNAVIAQRLVRKICDHCKEPFELSKETEEQVRSILSRISPASGEKVDLRKLQFFHGHGCDRCHGIGLKGRTGIFEVFTMNPEIEQIILSEQVSEHIMEDIAIKNGMVLMAQDGLLKALDGITTVEEVFRVAQ